MISKLLFLLLTFLITGCSTLRVTTDYDTNYDLSTLHTFAILHTKSDFKADTLTANRIEKALSNTLTNKHYKSAAKEEADFYIVYHINVTNKTQIDTDYQFVGMYPYRYGGSMVATTRSYNYDEGKLIIDLLDPKSKNIIFRSIATDELRNLETPQKREAYINKVVLKALESLPSK